MSNDNFDDSEFDYHIELDKQSHESGGPFYYGSVHYWEKDYKVVASGPDPEGFEITATGDTEEDVQQELYSRLAAAQEELNSKKA